MLTMLKVANIVIRHALRAATMGHQCSCSRFGNTVEHVIEHAIPMLLSCD